MMKVVKYTFSFLGNDMMKDEKYNEAIDFYGQAITIDPCNAVYYCNR